MTTAHGPLEEQIGQANASGLTPVVFIPRAVAASQQLGPLGRSLRPGRLRAREPGLA
jgi:hypothetical protein